MRTCGVSPSTLAPVERVMTVSAVKQLSNDALHRDLRALVADDRTTTVRLLIHIAEFDARGLYRESGYPSMHEYCVHELGMSEDIAYKRVRAAKKSRKHPRILVSLADGRLTLSAVAMLARHLTEQNAEELLTEVERKTNAQVRELIAHRFPEPDLPSWVQPIVAPQELAARPILDNCEAPASSRPQPVAEQVESAWRPPVKPLAPERYGVQFTIGQEDRELLEQAKTLLSHQIPSGDEAQVFVHALRALVRQLERRKFAKTDRPRKSPTGESKNPRHIPARVRRAVHDRDGGQCTFVSESGHRCEARKFLEFDHVLEVARGGTSTVENVRLRCRAHNQHTAEQTYGAGFMKAKREDAQRAAAERARARAAAEEVVPWLQALRIPADQARRAAQRCETMPDASLEDRVKAALSCFAPRDVLLRRAAGSYEPRATSSLLTAGSLPSPSPSSITSAA